MSRRLGGLLLVFLVAGAPAVLTACEMICAVRESQPQEAGHSCHGTQPFDGSLAVAAVHVCGHDDALPTAALQTVPLVLFGFPASPALASSHGVLLPGHAVVATPPGHPTRPLPLRI